MTNEELTVLYQAGDNNAGAMLYQKNRPFIIKLVKELIKNDDYHLKKDLMQVGAIALLEAAKDFDVSRGLKLLTLAGIRIKEQMHSYRQKNGETFSISISQYKLLKQIAFIYYSDEQKTHEEKIQYISEKYGVTKKRTENLIRQSSMLGMYLLVKNDPTLDYAMELSYETLPAHFYVYKELCIEYLYNLIETADLNNNDLEILKMYYGLFGEEEKTFEEISSICCTTASAQVKRHKEAIKKLKENLNGSKLELWREIYWAVMNIKT